MRVLSVVGNRPQLVKSAALSVALRGAAITETLLHTGQHYDRELSQIFFDELGLPPPTFELNLRTSDPALMLPGIARGIAETRPDWVLVYGDTNSTLAGARAAEAAGIPVAHVEAGLRSGDLAMPEERNRIAVDRIASLLLCPDERSRRTLEDEGVGGRIEVVGDVMADVALRFAPLARARSGVLERLGLEVGAYVVATLHREANVGMPRLACIVDGLNRVRHPVVFPAHPRTARALADHDVTLAPHVDLARPLGYLDFAALASQARAIVTDSGGLQKEAYWYGVPCVTTRPTTEWVDTVEAGANTLVDDDARALAATVAAAVPLPAERPFLYGDGDASARIAETLARL